MKGFGMTYDLRSGGFRNWYIDGEGAKRWADNDELVRGFHAQHDDDAAAQRQEQEGGSHGEG